MRRFAVLFVFALVGCGGNPNPAPPTPDPTPAVPTKPDPAPPSGSVKGALAHPGKKGEMLTVGYVEVAGTEFLTDTAGMSVPGPDEGDGWAESSVNKPRVAALRFEKGSARYEFTGLPAGSYVVYATVKGGPTTWAKVEVKAGDTLTRDLKLEPTAGGTVEVTLPADFAGEVKLAPSDLAPADDEKFVVGRVAANLGLGAKAEKGKATVANVPPGKYTLFALPGALTPRGTVEVKAGETAKAEIKDVK